MTVHTPRSLDDALALVRDLPDAHVLAGGTDMMVEINFNKVRPQHVVALRHVKELGAWSIDSASRTITIGAGVPYSRMETGEIARLVPALAEAARTVGSPQIRAAGTLGGNLGTCSPAGDGLPVLAALDARIHVRSSNAERTLPFDEFMVGPKRNSLRPDEIVVAVTVPIVEGWQGYAKVGTRNAMVISVASACLVVDRARANVAMALGSVGPTIIRCTVAEQFLASTGLISDGGRMPDDIVHQFAELVRDSARPIDDHRSTARYRRHAVGVLATRLIERSMDS